MRNQGNSSVVADAITGFYLGCLSTCYVCGGAGLAISMNVGIEALFVLSTYPCVQGGKSL